MGKQKALEYAEARLAEAEAEFAELEESYGENLENVYEMVSDGGNYDDTYLMGVEHGGVETALEFANEIIALLKEEGE
ncbi:hypothetical protein [Pantoea septica]|uniref:hypothetical protein n=1 Tax=Pantoea septica TaxID=472695 RepID=UPI001C1227B5|nr:hypothetical protein [Pantoea septica]MBU5379941.1 hypothetical protein [Pantoea septica]